MSISTEQWLQIEEELQSSICKVVFRLPGDPERKISVYRERTSESQLKLVVYFDGTLHPSWGHQKNNERFDPLTAELWRRRSKSIYKPAEVKRLERALGKRRTKKEMPQIYEPYVWYEPTFPTAKALVRQYRKHKELQLVQIGSKQVEEA